MVNGSPVKPPSSLVRVRNITQMRQSLGFIVLGPGEERELEPGIADEVLKYPYFERVEVARLPRVRHPREASARPLSTVGLVTEVRKALQPDPVTEKWIADLNREVFPCQTTEFDPIEKTDKTFGITFRLVDCSEMNGGTRFILRLAGYLGARGHYVRISCSRSPLKDEDLQGIPVKLVQERFCPDDQFVCGTYWTTIREIAGSPIAGKRIALLQAPEPSWPEIKPHELQARASFCDPSVTYFAIGPSLAKVVNAEYGTQLHWTLPGSCIDSVAFAPRINDHKPRDTVFFIYRRAAWKGLDTILSVVAAYKQFRPQTKIKSIGFTRLAHPLVDEYLVDPPTEDIPDFYSGADFYLAGGMYEGSPLPPLEAMACGCIPVSTESGVRDYLRDGENGLILDPKRPELAAKSMAAIMDDESRRQTLIRNGLLTARRRPMAMAFREFEKGVLALC